MDHASGHKRHVTPMTRAGMEALEERQELERKFLTRIFGTTDLSGTSCKNGPGPGKGRHYRKTVVA